MRFTEDTAADSRYVFGKVRDQYGMRGIGGEANKWHIGWELLSNIQHK